ncbi:MAG: PaaI family thioesterase [Pseudomonadales bacterium]
MRDSNDPAAVLELSAYAVKLGITCLSTAPDHAVFSMPFCPDNVTVGDIVHGGAILSLADVAATAAAWTTIAEPDRHRGLTISLSHVFLSAARSADLEAEARVTRRGNSICFVEVDIRNRETGESVSRAAVVYKLSRHR